MVKIAVLIPCLNEASTVESVIAGCRGALPHAAIYVYDNGSTDLTSKAARRAGAFVRSEALRGKGNVVRRMFADVEADVYLMVDGDATYAVDRAGALVERLVADNLDMVVATRVASTSKAYRFGHVLGNRTMNGIIGSLFGRRFTDVFSGFRVFSRRFVKSFPADSRGFEIEAELSIHALQLGLPTAEIPTKYRGRPSDSISKLSTLRDGVRIGLLVLRLYIAERALTFFSGAAAALTVAALALATPVIRDYLETGLVLRFPTAILAASMVVIAVVAIACGIISDSVARGRREVKRLQYLLHAPVSRSPAEENRILGTSG